MKKRKIALSVSGFRREIMMRTSFQKSCSVNWKAKTFVGNAEARKALRAVACRLCTAGVVTRMYI